MSASPPPVVDSDRWLVEAGTALLLGSRWLTWLSLALSGIAAYALAATDLHAALARVAASGALALGMLTAYLALRTTMDLEFFRVLRQSLPVLEPTLSSFDEALRGLGWLPRAAAVRPLADRIAGVRHLVRAQGAVLLAQTILVIGVQWLR